MAEAGDWGPHVRGSETAMRMEPGMEGSVTRPTSSDTSGRISAMCDVAPSRPSRYTCARARALGL